MGTPWISAEKKEFRNSIYDKKNKNVLKALVDNRYQWCFPESWKENDKELENMRPNGSI